MKKFRDTEGILRLIKNIDAILEHSEKLKKYDITAKFHREKGKPLSIVYEEQELKNFDLK